MSLGYKMRKRQSKVGFVVLFWFSIIELIIALIQINSDVSGDEYWPIKIFWATLIWFLIYLWSGYKYHRSFYLFSNAYLLVLGLFHLSLVYMIAMGRVEIASWTRGSTGVLIELAGWYIVIALCSFGLGTGIGAFTGKPENLRPESKIKLSAKTNRFIYIQALGLVLATIIFLIMALKSYGNILAYSRAELFNLGADSRGFGLFTKVLPGAIVLLTVSAKSKKQKLMAYPLAIIVFILTMLSGYRSAALFPALVGVVLWVKTGRKIPVIIAVSSVIFVLMSIAVIGVFRQLGTYEELGSKQLHSSYERASIADSFSEMGGSVGVFSEVLRFIPREDPYRFGYSYWLAFKEMFPNIGWTIDSSKSRKNKLAKATFDKSSLVEMRPAEWITYKVNRWKFDHGQGVGFSAIAEPYFNFGTGGVIGYFSLLGFILFRLELKQINYHPYLYLFMGSIFWTFLRTVRNDFSNFSKPMGFIIIILLIYNAGLMLIGKHIRFSRI